MIERADVLSLEVVTIEMERSKTQTSGGRAVEADCVAQVKINSDDVSIVAAAEHFLNKNLADIKQTVLPILEKHLPGAPGISSIEQAIQYPASCAANVERAAFADLAKMGLSMISFTIRNPRAI